MWLSKISHKTKENVEKVQNPVYSDRCLSNRTMAVQLNLYTERVRQILSDDLVMKKSFSKDGPITVKELWPKNLLMKWNTHPILLIWL
jgi:hypothetical protein